MTSKTDEPISQHVLMFILVGVLAGSDMISSVVLHLFPISKPYAHGIGIFSVFLLIYWLPQFRRKTRFSLLQWIVFSLIMSALRVAIALLFQAVYRLF